VQARSPARDEVRSRAYDVRCGQRRMGDATMTSSSQAGKRRGKGRSAKGSPVAMRGGRGTRGALGINRKAVKTMEADDKKILMRQSAVAPRAEPSTRGAKHWSAGRRQARKVH
jgi:hypothetical protein